MRISIYTYLLFLFWPCQSQTTEKRVFLCRNYSFEIEVPEITKIQTEQFTEGEAILLITKDSVVIEFYCAGNYSPHISDKGRYKILSNHNNSSIGIDLESNLYWRNDGRLIYSNCKVSDTAYYNKIFNNKIVRKRL